MNEEKPEISVVLPVLNRPTGLNMTLRSILDQTLPDEDYEVIVVDNGSRDRTPDVARWFENRYPQRVRFVSETAVQSSYAARNRGVQVARGRICCFIDADMTAPPGWLTHVRKQFQNSATDALAIRVDIPSHSGGAIETFNRLEGFRVKTRVQEEDFAPTCCLSVRRDIFEQIGSFDRRLVSGGDVEFGQRLVGAGYSIRYTSDIVLNHPPLRTFAEFYRKYRRIGRGMYQRFLYYPDRYPDLAFNVLNPRAYLPEYPWEFRRGNEGNPIWKSSGRVKKVFFYLLRWLEQLIKRIGYLHERSELKK